MQNLQNMAFRNDITTQLKEQGSKLEAQTSTQLKGVVQAVEQTRDEVAQVRQYNKKTTEEKINKIKAQISNQLKKKSGPNPEKMEQWESDLKRYEGLLEFETRSKELKLPSYTPPAGSVTQQDMSLPKAPAQVGGGVTTRSRSINMAREQQEFNFEKAPTSSKLLSAIDVNAPLHDFAKKQDVQMAKTVSGGQADISGNIGMFSSNLEGGISSGNPQNTAVVKIKLPTGTKKK